MVEVGAGPGTLARSRRSPPPRLSRRPALRGRGGRAPASVPATQPASSRAPRPPDRGRLTASSWPTSCSTTCRSGSPCSTGGWREAFVIAEGRDVRRGAQAPLDPLPSVLPEVAPPTGRGRRCRRARRRAGDAAAAALAPAGRRARARLRRPTTAELTAIPWREWLRTYRGHERGGRYLADARVEQDITADVAARPAPAARRRAQSGAVPPALRDRATSSRRGAGLDGKRRARPTSPRSRCAAGSARPRPCPGPGGLGGFTVLEWATPVIPGWPGMPGPGRRGGVASPGTPAGGAVEEAGGTSEPKQGGPAWYDRRRVLLLVAPSGSWRGSPVGATTTWCNRWSTCYEARFPELTSTAVVDVRDAVPGGTPRPGPASRPGLDVPRHHGPPDAPAPPWRRPRSRRPPPAPTASVHHGGDRPSRPRRSRRRAARRRPRRPRVDGAGR